MNTADRHTIAAARRLHGLRLVPVLLAAALAVACSSEASQGEDAPPAPEVSVAQVVARPVQQWDDFSGRLSAVETVELRPRVSGYVQRVAYEEGQVLGKGDLLFEIDPRPYRAALDQAQAELERARSEAKLASAQNVRAQALVEARAISREEFETRNAATPRAMPRSVPPRPRSPRRGWTCSSPRCVRRSMAAPVARW
jgi:multidrug efflux system membrane fusion protein